MQTQISLVNEDSSKLFAIKVAQYIQPPMLLTFSGEIGTGKTTFIREMIKSLGIKSTIKSPTFSLVESYPYLATYQIHHFDMYRVHDEDELEYIGFRDYLTKEAICLVEWPEKASQSLIHADINFKFTLDGSGRLLTIQTLSYNGEKLFQNFAGQK